jgi:hypothetical protein
MEKVLLAENCERLNELSAIKPDKHFSDNNFARKNVSHEFRRHCVVKRGVKLPCVLCRYTHSTRKYVGVRRLCRLLWSCQGVGLRPLACWDCGFESRRRYKYLPLLTVVCCQVEVSATGRSLVQRSITECGVSECDREDSTVRPRPTRDSLSMERKEKQTVAPFRLMCIFTGRFPAVR